MTASVRIVQLFDDLLGTHSDGGNTRVLAQRAAWRDIAVTVVEVAAPDPIPADGDIYLLGGGTGAPLGRLTHLVSASPSLARAVARGATVLGVGAGSQVLGRRLVDAEGSHHEGLGLLDVLSAPAHDPVPDGEVVVTADPRLGLDPLIGWLDRSTHTRVGVGARPLGVIVEDHPGPVHAEGAHAGRVVGTHLHGPVLVANPTLADRLLAWGLGVEPDDLAPVDDAPVTALRAARLAARDVARAHRWATPVARIRRFLG